jgi:threonyl-tRNA synthetase
MLHRVIIGSIERFIGILIEHYAGAFPAWLAPVQVVILNITDSHLAYAEKIYKLLFEEEIRVEKDFRNEKLGYKVREHQLQKIPYMLIVGDREIKEGGVSVRSRDEGDIGSMSVEAFLSRFKSQMGLIHPAN